MSRYHSYINSAKQILELYKGDEPFASFLKKYFGANKKFGSKDRKQVSHLCYCFFRLGKTAMALQIEERPIALNGQVVIKPMMYVALSYDHRIIDGRESVSFLVRVKELLENPDQLLFGKDPVRTLLEI